MEVVGRDANETAYCSSARSQQGEVCHCREVILDVDDLDTPAYLRQGTLLN